jgi:Nuclease-related domain
MDKSSRRNPLTRDLLRSPGETLREEIEDANWDIATYVAFTPLASVGFYAGYISEAAFTGRFPAVWVTVLYALVALAVLAWLVWKICALLGRRRQLVLGYEAELAVGQELNQLMRKGFHVFHDIPARGFNVDHVVVGTEGVFAVETKGRTKTTKDDGRTAEWEVKYDGEYLDFPDWRTKEPLDQAARQAKSLAAWLSSAVGDAVSADPVVVLPGWYVRRTGKPRVAVIGGGEIYYYFPKVEPRHRLSDQLITRIVHQLDQRCRNVEPRAYRQENENRRKSSR